MRINVDQQILTLEGEPFNPPSSLRAAIFHVLISPLPEDQHLNLDAKLKVHSLAQRVLARNKPEFLPGTKIEVTGSVIDLAPEDLVLIKQRANHVLHIHFLGQFIALLEREWEPPRGGEFASEASRESRTYHPEDAAIKHDSKALNG